MFGRIHKKREKRHKKREEERKRQEALKQQAAEAQDPEKMKEEFQQTENLVSDLQAGESERLAQQREDAKKQAMEEVTTEIPGMSPERKRALQESANAKIDSQVQNYQRMMASQMGKAGVRGGAAYAPQYEIASKGLQAQQQFQRDLLEQDEQVALQKLAAYMASLEGKTAEDILRRQQILDYLQSKKAAANLGYQTGQAANQYYY